MTEKRCTAKYGIVILSFICSLPIHAQTTAPSNTTAGQLVSTALLLNTTATTLNHLKENMTALHTTASTDHSATVLDCYITRALSISWNHNNSRMAVGVAPGWWQSDNPCCKRTGVVQIFDMTKRRPQRLRTLKHAKDWVESVQYSPDGSQLAAASRDGQVRIYKGKETDSWTDGLRLYNTALLAIAYSHDGSKIAVGGTMDTVNIFSSHNLSSILATIQGLIRPVNSIAFAPGDSQIAIGGGDFTVRIYSVNDPDKVLRTLKDGRGTVRGIDYSPDSRWLAVGKGNKKVMLYYVEPNDPSHTKTRLVQTLEEATGRIKSLAFSPDTKKIQLAAGGDDKKVRIYELENNPGSGLKAFRLRKTLKDAKGRIRSLAYSTDGRRLATGDDDGKVYTYRLDRHGIPERNHSVISIVTADTITCPERSVPDTPVPGQPFTSTVSDTPAPSQQFTSPVSDTPAPSQPFTSTVSDTLAPGQPFTSPVSDTPAPSQRFADLTSTRPASSSSTATLSWLLLAGFLVSQMF